MLKFILKSIVPIIKASTDNLKNRYDVFKKFQLHLKQGCKISNPQNITIGTEFGISPFCQLFANGELGDAEIIIGDNVALNYNVMINADCGGSITIGDNVRIGPYTVMRASNHKYSDVNIPIYEQGHNPGRIIIEEDVWFGGHVTVLPNVKIGRSSVIGAGSVVVSDIPPFSVLAGVPAKVIKSRMIDIESDS